jgi:hypothetical protein
MKMAAWDIRIIAPNGSDAHVVAEETVSDEELVAHMMSAIIMIRRNDVAEDSNSVGVPQQSKQAKGDRNAAV